VVKSSRFEAYDQQATRTLSKWTFKPFMHEGTAVPVCSSVTIQSSK
jgi:outer membrane biosynthesis protein TonB